ncbi:hypothetical protein RIF29_01961 [Crotalaria pallida]|uniref:Uncharacterized protein n=1 Tax=Crotalaria pallida TaxID=3830 RepID=A0AAN9P8A8_CROPI
MPFTSSGVFPPTTLATLYQRSGVSLSYTARALSKALLSLALHEPEVGIELDAIADLRGVAMLASFYKEKGKDQEVEQQQQYGRISIFLQ